MPRPVEWGLTEEEETILGGSGLHSGRWATGLRSEQELWTLCHSEWAQEVNAAAAPVKGWAAEHLPPWAPPAQCFPSPCARRGDLWVQDSAPQPCCSIWCPVGPPSRLSQGLLGSFALILPSTGDETRALCVVSKCSPNELHPSLCHSQRGRGKKAPPWMVTPRTRGCSQQGKGRLHGPRVSAPSAAHSKLGDFRPLHNISHPPPSVVSV